MEVVGKMDSSKIREVFLDFFRNKQHTIVPSAPMVVKNDPTLMFTNAGMNQFKDIFLGNSPITSSRVADSQKCLRVSGKHNDLEQVGYDTYHHTMFEMLGNWSFGDYFKKEAIEWAWELLVDVYGLDPERMYASIFEGDQTDGVPRDEEAYTYWAKKLPKEQIILGSKRDNFWEMGENGPCGPCSEVHYDLRDDSERRKVNGRDLVNADHPEVIEIWNLVFIQFNRRANGSLETLPKKHVDTGMGFERLCMIIQGKKSNYDTDVFQPLIQKIASLAGKKYGENGSDDIAMRVISDHLRAIAFSIADGQLPSNVRAGYVIRRILRRAVRYGYTYLGFNEPFMYKLVETMIDKLGGQYPELKAQKGLIENVIREEESSFLGTLSTGITLINNVIKKAKAKGEKSVSGKDAFTMYDTYGFPIDLTELIAREHGLEVDLVEFEKELTIQKERSRSDAAVSTEDWVVVCPIEESIFVGYHNTESEIQIARYRKVQTKGKEFYQVVFDQTPFYGASGGQVGDSGYIEADGVQTEVKDTLKDNQLTVHIMKKLPDNVDAVFTAVVDLEKRNNIAANHTATHLMHEALREVLGTHVEQKGSLVASDYLRFDFSHFQKVENDQLREVEKLVNKRIRANLTANEVLDCTIENAEQMGAIMLFGEKYGDRVRVMQFGTSIELCGGTHVASTGSIGLFKIHSEGAISAGVRRIEAVTGYEAEKVVYLMQATLQEIQGFLNHPQIMPGIQKLLSENEVLLRQLDEYRREKIEAIIKDFSEELTEENGLFLFARKILIPTDMIKDIASELRRRMPNLVLVIGSDSDDKATLSIVLGEAIVKKGVNASEIIREVAPIIEGGGGGQPFFATAGGKNAEGVDKAIASAVELIKNIIENIIEK